MYTEEERIILKKAELLFKENDMSDIFINHVSFHGYCEESVCLEKIDDERFNVFFGEKGNEYELQEFTNIFDAVVNVIKKIAVVDVVVNELTEQFKKMIDSDDSKHLNYTY